MKQARINVRTAVNASRIRRERRDGRDVIIVPSATLPDDVINRAIVRAASQASKAADWLLGLLPDEDQPSDGAAVAIDRRAA